MIHFTIRTDRMNAAHNDCQDLKSAVDYIFFFDEDFDDTVWQYADPVWD